MGQDDDVVNVPTLEEAAAEIRRLAVEALDRHGQDGRYREITLSIGPLPGAESASLPRKAHQTVMQLGLNNTTVVAAIIDRALHLLRHPTISEIEFNITDPNTVQITDCNGKRFEIQVTEL